MSAYSHLLDEERDSIFGRIAPALRKSITFDNDIAFAQRSSENYARHDHMVL
jgi:hypothetical protein